MVITLSGSPLKEDETKFLREKERDIEKVFIKGKFKEILLPLIYDSEEIVSLGENYDVKFLKAPDPSTGRIFILRGDFTPLFVSEILPRIKGKKKINEKVFYRGEIIRINPVKKEPVWDYQLGAEWIGEVKNEDMLEVICEIASVVSDEFVFLFSHTQILKKLLEKEGFEVNSLRVQLLKRDISFFNGKLKSDSLRMLKRLFTEIGGKEVLKEMKRLTSKLKCEKEMEEITSAIALVERKCGRDKWKVDFGNWSSFEYHTGLFFEVLSPSGIFIKGGRYDDLFRRLGYDIRAIGFGIYLLELLER